MKKLKILKTLTKNEIFSKNDNFWEGLSKKAYPLTKGKLRIPISVEPFSVTADEFLKLEDNLQLLISAAKKLSSAYFDNELLQNLISVNPEEKQLINESRKEDFIGIIRVDLFYGKSPKIVEINADFPDGFFMHDITPREICKWFIKEKDKYRIFDHAKLFNELLESLVIDKNSHIFIGYDKARKFIDEFALNKMKLEKDGWKNVSMGAFEDLEFINEKLYFDKRPIDVIRRGAELFKLRKIPGLMKKLVSEQQKGRIKIINNFKMRLLGHKALMAVLWDKRFRRYLNKNEIKAIKLLLPETLKLKAVDIPRLLDEKDLWVLKPSDLAEGESIYIGSVLTNKKWNKAVRLALKKSSNWIVQKKVDIPEEKFNLIDNENRKTIQVKRKFDFNPHVILLKKNCKLGWIINRYSELEVLNVMKGGGLTYTFVEK